MQGTPALRFAIGALIILSAAALIIPAITPHMPVVAGTEARSADSGIDSLALIQQAATQTPTPTPTATPIPQPTASVRPDLVVWWPVEFLPPQDTPEEAAVLDLIDTYRSTADISLLMRVKRLSGTGSILSTLRTGHPVAPGALPDLTLVRAAHLAQLVSDELIFPLDANEADTLLQHVYTRVTALGTVGDTLYGVPYALNVQHAVYPQVAFEATPDTFEEVLNAARLFAFALGSDSGASDVLLIQYVAAGGRLTNDEGQRVLDEVPLRDVLRFYASAQAEALLHPDSLTLTDAGQTWSLLVDGSVSLAQTDSDTFLRQQGSNAGLVPAALPTRGGNLLTTLDGWVWVITTPDPNRQAQARAFLDWLLQAENQAALTEALHTLPSQRAALQNRIDADYVALIDRLLGNSNPILAYQVDATTATALQQALVAVLSGELSAEAAAETAAAQFAP
ncbi:MAG: hypothetical protein Kow0077_00390 [Anaerolineae bacterium]